MKDLPLGEFKKRSWKLGAVAATLNTPFGACVCAAIGLVIPNPKFFGDATIRDGQVHCNFLDKDGMVHWNARYDTFEVLQDNMRRTADVLQLDNRERGEFLRVMNEWIGAPYTVGARFLTWEGEHKP